MKNIEKLLRMMERPQDFTDEELQQLMDDPDIQAYYELMVQAEEGFAQRKTKREKGLRLWKIAAMFIGIILLSGITYAAVHITRGQEPEERKQENVVVTKVQPAVANRQQSDSDSIRTFVNTELEQILSELADHYHVDVDFRNEQTRHIRLYTKWDTTAPLSQMIDRLNNFERINIRQTENHLIAE